MELADIPLLILAGGSGTRLRPLTLEIPKYLAPISGEKLFADYHLKWAREVGFRNIILSVGYKAEQIQEYCGNGEKWDLKIQYLIDGDKPLGTGGAVQQSLEFEFNHLALTYGDTLLDFAVEDCFQEYLKLNKPALMTVHKNQISGHTCNVNPVTNKSLALIEYNKNNPNSNWEYIDYGFMFLNRNFIERFSFLAAVLPFDLAMPLTQLSEDGDLAGYLCANPFKEIGSMNSLNLLRLNQKVNTI